MKKRVTAAILTAALLLSAGGCAAAYKKEYLSVSEYTEEDHNEFLGDAVEISDYSALKRALNEMVLSHTSEERLIFTNYDGSIQNDLGQAYVEIQDETPLGSYAVDYMSHDLTRIITYYEATVYIKYKRTEAEVGSIVTVSGRTGLITNLDQTLSSLNSGLVVRMYGRVLDTADIALALDRAFGSNPLSCVLTPEAEISIHPNSGFDRIVEISLTYPQARSVLTAARTTLTELVEALASAVSSTTQPAVALELYNTLSSRCRYDPDGSLRSQDPELDPEGGDRLQAALTEGLADSRGFALAYSALCREAGIECITVTGTMNQDPHWWNIVKIDGEYYHVDVSSDMSLGVTGAFLRSSSQMRSAYWWNIDDYPDCPSSINASDLFSPVF